MIAKMRNDFRTSPKGIEKEEKFVELLRKEREEGRLVE